VRVRADSGHGRRAKARGRVCGARSAARIHGNVSRSGRQTPLCLQAWAGRGLLRL